MSLSKRKAKLDDVFSKWVRLTHADEGGTVRCITCDELRHWKTVHAGHFVPRQHMATRWDERNVHPQCPKCNAFNQGEQYLYGLYLDRQYGDGTALALRALGRTTRKWTIPEVNARIEGYQAAVKSLLSKIPDY